jgi:N-acetylglucosamine kinase-like BadF-type ATPase
MENFILGVDGGATKTIARVTDLEGRLIAESVGRSSNYKSDGVDLARKNISSVLLEVFNKAKINNNSNKLIVNSCFGLSGCDCEEDKIIYRKIILNSNLKKYLNPSNIIICNDTKIGLVAGTKNKNGVIIICGTGMNCFGMNEVGDEHGAGGWDYLLGDQGSGYEISLKALKAVMKYYDNRGPKTLLTETIMEKLKIHTINDLFNWAYSKPFSKEKISDLAITVCKTAELGDKVSIKILKDESNEAFISIMAVAKKLQITKKKFDLVFVGSVFKCEKYFKDILINKLIKKNNRIEIIPLVKKPVEGAIKIALENL